MHRLREQRGRTLWASLTSRVLDSYFKTQLLPPCPLCLSLRGVTRTVLDSKSKVRRRRVHGNRRRKGCTFFLFSLWIDSFEMLHPYGPCDPFSPSVVSFGKEAHTRKFSFHLHVCFSSFPFHNLWTDSSLWATFDKEHKVSKFQKLWENAELAEEWSMLKDRQGWLSPRPFFFAAPGWAGSPGRAANHCHHTSCVEETAHCSWERKEGEKTGI